MAYSATDLYNSTHNRNTDTELINMVIKRLNCMFTLQLPIATNVVCCVSSVGPFKTSLY